MFSFYQIPTFLGILVLAVYVNGKAQETTESDRARLLQQAQQAHKTEKYDDMVSTMKSIVQLGVPLTNEERELLDIAFKNAINTRRASCRTFWSTLRNKNSTEEEKNKAREKLAKVRAEWRPIVYDILGILNKFIALADATNAEGTVHYLRMKGDFYKFLTEQGTEDEKQMALDEIENAYTLAYEISKYLDEGSVLRLKLGVEFSDFYLKMVNSPEKGCEVAKNVADKARPKLVFSDKKEEDLVVQFGYMDFLQEIDICEKIRLKRIGMLKEE